jgi:uncharacterized protein YdbL (DUF1318 family)
MNKHRTTLLGILFLCLTAASAAAADSDEMKQLQRRFQERLPAIQKLKAAGLVGETSAGFLEAREKIDADTQKTVDGDNADRRKLYQLIADQEGVTPAKVAERNAVRNFQKAKPGEYLKGADGAWKKKA